MESGLFCVLPWLTMAVLANIGGGIAYTLISRGLTVTLVRKVYPNSWTTIYVSLDNQGIWNLRSALWSQQYLGQQLYLRVWNEEKTFANEYDPPTNVLLCGLVGKQLDDMLGTTLKY